MRTTFGTILAAAAVAACGSSQVEGTAPSEPPPTESLSTIELRSEGVSVALAVEIAD